MSLAPSTHLPRHPHPLLSISYIYSNHRFLSHVVSTGYHPMAIFNDWVLFLPFLPYSPLRTRPIYPSAPLSTPLLPISYTYYRHCLLSHFLSTYHQASMTGCYSFLSFPFSSPHMPHLPICPVSTPPLAPLPAPSNRLAPPHSLCSAPRQDAEKPGSKLVILRLHPARRGDEEGGWKEEELGRS